MKAPIYILSICFLVTEVSAQEAESGFRAGPTMAVQEASLKDGIRLTDKAKEVIGVETRKIGSSPFAAPTAALVHFGNRIGVYRFRNNWFKLIEIKVISKKENSVTFSAAELKDNDQIVVAGVALLRVSEMDAFGGEE